MKMQLLNSLHLVVIGGLMLGMTVDVVAEPEIVGSPRCKSCHKSRTGDQWKIWTESTHANAFETLASEESRKIAAEKGLGDPQQENACLRCHATKAFLGADAIISEKANYDDSEGVGCESCHGPGSDYRPKKIMTDPQAARMAGLMVDSSSEACSQCHNEESPTFKGFDFEQRWAEIKHPVPGLDKASTEVPTGTSDIPGVVTFTSSVGDVLFDHNLHVNELETECAECHHQIHASVLDTPHESYLKSTWINCEICHTANPEIKDDYFKCSSCHHSDPDNVADETLSSKVVIHKSCWSCHESGTGVTASHGCKDCHVNKQN
jgi:hypothetical protein